MRLGVAGCTLLLGASLHADPLVLTANALATTTSPAGLVTVSADASLAPGVAVEAVVWTGGGGNLTGETPGDVLVMVMRAHTRDGMISGEVTPASKGSSRAGTVSNTSRIVAAMNGMTITARIPTIPRASARSAASLPGGSRSRLASRRSTSSSIRSARSPLATRRPRSAVSSGVSANAESSVRHH